jgi:hypothetical protein
MRFNVLLVMLVAACQAPDDGPDLEAARQAIVDPDDPPPPRSGPINPLPSGLYVDSNQGGRTIMIRWMCGGNAEYQGSKIQKSGGDWQSGDRSCNVSQVWGLDSVPVQPNTQYCFRAYAQNTTHVAQTQPVCVTSDRYREDPVAPSVIGITAKVGRIEVRYTDRSDIESGFRIYRALGYDSPPSSEYTLVAELGALSGTGDTIAWDDRDFERDTYYWYRVEVWHPWGTASAMVSRERSWPRTPASPTFPVFGLVVSDRVRFEWRDNSSNEDTFHVSAVHENGDSMFKTVGANATSATFDEDDGLHEGLWYFEVSAWNRAGGSNDAVGAVIVPGAGDDDDGDDGGGGGTGTLNVCGLGCPGGYHATRFNFDASCPGGPTPNATTCGPNTGTFSACGVGCPTGWHSTSQQYTTVCVVTIGSLNDNQSTCQAHSNDFWSCETCPPGWMLTDTLASTACFHGTKYHCHK